MDNDNVTIYILFQFDFCVSECKIDWIVITDGFLYFLNVFGIIWIIQSFPKWSFTLSDFNVTSFRIFICIVIKFVVYINTGLLEMSMSWMIIKIYRTCPKILPRQILATWKIFC